MTIIAGLFVAIFSRLLGRWQGAIAALLGMLYYTLLVGPSASVVRAALMGGLALFVRQIGRRQQGLNSLAFVAALMALFNPRSCGISASSSPLPPPSAWRSMPNPLPHDSSA